MTRKYIKPMMKDIGDLSITYGSCVSGNIERTITGPCLSGANAIDSCSTGSNILPRSVCTSGNLAGASCFSGSNAG